ncbi:MAG: DUF4037 domain-containing protein [Clostridia bacterium]|nr:DUF4037 domain-containing protein [Clostridia bacterium]
MKGIELAKRYYEECGKEMLLSQFPSVRQFLAVGLSGSGSECYGYDDELSRDHDFEPAFCIFLPGEDIVDRATAFSLERAYSKLPHEFMGFSKNAVNPVGGSRHGVIRMDEFFLEKVGSPDGRLSPAAWLTVPEYGLLEATNGEVFSDPYGAFSAVRERLSYFPEDVRLKKLAGHLLLMAQSGQYNYGRCVTRGETAAAQLAVFEFAKSALHCIYLLNRRYMPYYKWCFRGLKELPVLGELSADLEYLISSGNGEEYERKAEIIERVCAAIAAELSAEGVADVKNCDMEHLAYTVNDKITDGYVRNLHILHGV